MREAKHSYKFMQVLDIDVWNRLKVEARKRGVTAQEIIRVVIIPDWFAFRDPHAITDRVNLYLEQRNLAKKRQLRRAGRAGLQARWQKKKISR